VILWDQCHSLLWEAHVIFSYSQMIFRERVGHISYSTRVKPSLNFLFSNNKLNSKRAIEFIYYDQIVEGNIYLKNLSSSVLIMGFNESLHRPTHLNRTVYQKGATEQLWNGHEASRMTTSYPYFSGRKLLPLRHI